VDVNVRFGFIRYAYGDDDDGGDAKHKTDYISAETEHA
jgi:hypothetical protein